jgi:uncharacterized protein (TIGR02231 family)
MTMHPHLASLMAILAASSAFTTLPALAAEVPFASRIDAVTVFPDAAAITRVGEVELPAGSHLLVLKNLPASVDPSSIRVEGKAARAITIGTAETRSQPVDTKPNLEADRKLKELRGELSWNQGRIDAVEAERRAIERYAAAAPEASAKDGKPVDIATWRAAWSAVGEAMTGANERLSGFRQKAADLELEIKAGEAARGRPVPNMRPETELTVAVEAGEATKASFTVSYRVRDARWLPVYDAVLDTGGGQTQANTAKPKMELVRRAMVSQRSGEDWSDVALTLSTSRVAGGAAAPDLTTQTVALYEPDTVLFEASRQKTLQRVAPAPAMAAKPDGNVADSDANETTLKQRAREQEAQLAAGAFSAAFVVPGRVSVTRDGAQRNLRLSATSSEPVLGIRTVPALDTTAYLSASFVHEEDAPLLPGMVSLTRDGVFVGRAPLKLTAPGETIDLGFGADDRVKIERVPVRRRDNDPTWSSSARVQIAEFKTTITSRHSRPIKVTVLDRLPVSENTAITVEQLKETTPPTEKQVSDKRGVMAWTFDAEPSKPREIRIAWRMRWPADREIVRSP